MLVSGIADLIEYCRARSHMFRPGWILFTSILDILMGVLVLFTNAGMVVAGLLPYFLSAWIVLRGIFTIKAAFDMKRLSASKWWISLIFGVMIIVFGLLSFVQPIVSAVTISTFVGIELIAASVATLVTWWRWVKANQMVKRFQKEAKANWETFVKEHPGEAEIIRQMMDNDLLGL